MVVGVTSDCITIMSLNECRCHESLPLDVKFVLSGPKSWLGRYVDGLFLSMMQPIEHAFPSTA